MSRVRKVGEIWFDKHLHNAPATPEQLEKLADFRGEDLDELLEEGLRQKEVMEALREAEGTMRRPTGILPPRVSSPAPCRICTPQGWECEGSSSKHHFIPRWMMKLLEDYLTYSPRNVCTIPICIGRHRDLHLRGDERTPKSMVGLLTKEEGQFANKLLSELETQRPQVFEILLDGDDTTYEHVLVKDFTQGKFGS